MADGFSGGLVGPAGPKGDKGDKGVDGAAGPPGPSGAEDVGGQFSLSANQAAGVGDQPILWDQNDDLTAGITHSISSNKEKIIVVAAGVYMFGMTFNPTVNLGDILGYKINAGAVKYMSDGNFAQYASWTDRRRLAAGDYITFIVNGNGLDKNNSNAWIQKVA